MCLCVVCKLPCGVVWFLAGLRKLFAFVRFDLKPCMRVLFVTSCVVVYGVCVLLLVCECLWVVGFMCLFVLCL